MRLRTLPRPINEPARDVNYARGLRSGGGWRRWRRGGGRPRRRAAATPCRVNVRADAARHHGKRGRHHHLRAPARARDTLRRHEGEPGDRPRARARGRAPRGDSPRETLAAPAQAAGPGTAPARRAPPPRGVRDVARTGNHSRARARASTYTSVGTRAQPTDMHLQTGTHTHTHTCTCTAQAACHAPARPSWTHIQARIAQHGGRQHVVRAHPEARPHSRHDARLDLKARSLTYTSR